MRNEEYVIVGAGVAGASAAGALRDQGFDGRIIMLGDEGVAPYERPPLSKHLLRGQLPESSVFLNASDFYSKHSIDLRDGEAARLVDPHERFVETAQGKRIRYDKLLIATGAAPRHLDVPGIDLPGVHYLRTLHDGLRLRDSLRTRPRVLMLGSGFIGCEVTASARQLGCEVMMIGKHLPLEQPLGSQIGEAYTDYHRSKGVDVKTDVTILEILGSPDAGVQHVRLSDQSVVQCDVVIIGIGVSPAAVAIVPGLKVENGIVTDEFCRTNIDGVFAAGDVASSWHPRFNRYARLEHFDNGRRQGAAAGIAMAGQLQPYDDVPYFWSDQFELHLQYHGHASGWDDFVVRGRLTEYAFSAFYLKAGRIEALCNVNRHREVSAAKRLIGRSDISAAVLADEGTDLAHV
jgi:3-phenylpropionate/trans-cinnamate dioxygenase ferredoxin reductase subunit